MISEKRNELLAILYLVNSTDKDAKKRNLDVLLESIERDINNQIKELNSKREELEDNYLLLEYVREKIRKECL